MVKKLLVCIFFLFIPINMVLADDVKVEFEGRYWITNLSGSAKVVDHGIGTDIDFKSDLGLTNKNFPEGRFTWYTGPNSRLRLAYTQIDYSGDKDIARILEFNGKTYTLGTRVITDLKVNYLKLGWIWQFIHTADGVFKLGTVLEAKGFWTDTSLKAPNMIPPIDESKKLVAGLPTVGLAIDINPHEIVNIFGEVSGLPAGKYGYFFDGEAGVKIIPIKNFSIVGGYRLFDIKADDDPNYAKLRISGPFVGATVRF